MHYSILDIFKRCFDTKGVSNDCNDAVILASIIFKGIIYFCNSPRINLMLTELI